MHKAVQKTGVQFLRSYNHASPLPGDNYYVGLPMVNLDDTDDLDRSKVKRVVMCSGKVFYDLRAARRDRARSLEQRECPRSTNTAKGRQL